VTATAISPRITARPRRGVFGPPAGLTRRRAAESAATCHVEAPAGVRPWSMERPPRARLRRRARLDHAPAGFRERARPLAALPRVRVVRRAGDHAAHDALRDRREPEHGKGHVELPLGDRPAADAPAVRRDELLLRWDAERGQVLAGEAAERARVE